MGLGLGLCTHLADAERVIPTTLARAVGAVEIDGGGRVGAYRVDVIRRADGARTRRRRRRAGPGLLGRRRRRRRRRRAGPGLLGRRRGRRRRRRAGPGLLGRRRGRRRAVLAIGAALLARRRRARRGGALLVAEGVPPGQSPSGPQVHGLPVLIALAQGLHVPRGVRRPPDGEHGGARLRVVVKYDGWGRARARPHPDPDPEPYRAL